MSEHTRNQKRMYRIHKQEEKILEQELMIASLQQKVEEKNNEIDRLNNLNKQLVEECQRLDDEETRLNNIIKGYNLILRDIGDECYEKKMETGDAGYYDIMEKIDKLIGE